MRRESVIMNGESCNAAEYGKEGLKVRKPRSVGRSEYWMM